MKIFQNKQRNIVINGINRSIPDNQKMEYKEIDRNKSVNKTSNIKYDQNMDDNNTNKVIKEGIILEERKHQNQHYYAKNYNYNNTINSNNCGTNLDLSLYMKDINNKYSNEFDIFKTIPFNDDVKKIEKSELNLRISLNHDLNPDLSFLNELNNRETNNNKNNKFIKINSNVNDPLDNEGILSYKSYFLKENGVFEENQDFNKLSDFIKNPTNVVKYPDTKNKIFKLDDILRKVIFKDIMDINKRINISLLRYFFDEEKLINHFKLTFNVFLFNAGFSMNMFIFELIQKTVHENIILKEILDKIVINSDIALYKDLFQNLRFSYTEYFQSNKNKNLLNLNSFSNDDLLKVEYIPQWPINIFYDINVNSYYNAIFNFLLKIKIICYYVKEIGLFKNFINLERTSKREISIKISKVFLNIRIYMLDFLNRLEFYFFNIVIEEQQVKFLDKLKNITTIDDLISSHCNMLKEIYLAIGIKNEVN